MERKVQNFQSRRRCIQMDKSFKFEKKRSSSVHPLLRASPIKIPSDGIHRKYNVNEDKLTFNSLTSVSLPRQRDQATDVQISEDNSTKHSRCMGRVKADKMKQSYSSSTATPRNVGSNSEQTLKAELSRCKRELSDYNNATRELEQKYMKINVELGEMQQRHERFLADRSAEKNSEGDDCSRSCSEYSIKRKNTQVFERNKNVILLVGGRGEPQDSARFNENQQIVTSSSKTQHRLSEQSYMNACRNNRPQQTSENSVNDYHGKHADLKAQLSKVKSSKERSVCSGCQNKVSIDNLSYFDTPTSTSSDLSAHKHFCNTANLNRIYETLQQAICSEQKVINEPTNVLVPDSIKELQKTITELHNEQTHFCNVIRQQQKYLQDYHSRCAKAKSVMNAQKNEIEKLTQSKKDLQEEVDKRLDKVRLQLDDKLRVMAPLSQQLRDTNARYEKIVKDNRALMERVRNLQTQAKDFKLKLEDLTKRKAIILGKLKNAERDLRVYKSYNASLKTEKLRQTEEIQKTREQLETQQAASKRALSRQRDINDKHCRDLQRRIFELEKKLGRSNNSTSGLLQQRDRLISELQAQVNTLVHNFEVSQKHIRVLRRQIVNAAGLSNTVAGTTAQRKNI